MADRRGAALLALSLVLMAGAPPLRAAEAVDLSGYWVLKMEGPAGAMDMNAAFAQEGDVLTGKLDGPMGSLPLEGKVRGAEVSFMVVVESPEGDYEMTFTGTLQDDDTIVGKLVGGEGEFETAFTAERRGATPDTCP